MLLFICISDFINYGEITYYLNQKGMEVAYGVVDRKEIVSRVWRVRLVTLMMRSVHLDWLTLILLQAWHDWQNLLKQNGETVSLMFYISCNKSIWSIWHRLHKSNFGVIFLSNVQRLSIESCMCIYVQALARCQQPI